MCPHVTWIEEKGAEGAGEPGAGGGPLRAGPLNCVLRYSWAFHGLRWEGEGGEEEASSVSQELEGEATEHVLMLGAQDWGQSSGLMGPEAGRKHPSWASGTDWSRGGS